MKGWSREWRGRWGVLVESSQTVWEINLIFIVLPFEIVLKICWLSLFELLSCVLSCNSYTVFLSPPFNTEVKECVEPYLYSVHTPSWRAKKYLLLCFLSSIIIRTEIAQFWTVSRRWAGKTKKLVSIPGHLHKVFLLPKVSVLALGTDTCLVLPD